ncbi:MAG: phosphoribosyltransferase family protein [Solirubrobacterales bacterium]
MPFKDRKHAGVELSESSQLKELCSPLVVALPRGAVVVGVEIARALDAPLFVMPVEDVATPGNPEYIVGAVAENAIHVIDADALAALGVTEDSLAVRVAEATARIARLSRLYRGEFGSLADADGRPVIVVDDGSATTPSLEAVAVALARHNVDTLLLVTPAVPDERPQGYEQVVSTARDEDHADGMALIGTWYDDRTAPSDEVAAEMLHEYSAARASR